MEHVAHVLRQERQHRVVAPVEAKVRDADRVERERHEQLADGQRRPRVVRVAQVTRDAQVLALAPRDPAVRQRRLERQEHPGDRPDQADAAEDVEGGRPAAVEAGVAQVAAQWVRDHSAHHCTRESHCRHPAAVLFRGPLVQ